MPRDKGQSVPEDDWELDLETYLWYPTWTRKMTNTQTAIWNTP